jgi:hypothetical protein
MAALSGTLVVSRIVPTDSLDTYATHDADFGRGGQRTVDTIFERDAIPDQRRKEGMLVWVIETGAEYRLVGGISNTNWVEAGSSGSHIIRVTEDYAMASINGIVLCDCTANDITITLPILDDGTATYTATIKKIDGSINKVTLINPVGSIDGEITREIVFKNTSVTLVSYQNEFYII